MLGVTTLISPIPATGKTLYRGTYEIRVVTS